MDIKQQKSDNTQERHGISMRFFAPLGVLLVILGEGLAFIHVLPWSQYVFPLFWYGYILIVDWLNLRLQGR